jgi:hypothetical protein
MSKKAATSLEGYNKTNLRQEPYTNLTGDNLDVVFQPNGLGDGYVPLIDDGIEANVIQSPYNVETPLIKRTPVREDSPFFIRSMKEQFYVGTLSVIGLFILFRMIQKSKA